MNDYLLEIKNITKRFPGVVALDNVSFNVKKGEVHALVGENGAGKSTLMKILSGAYSINEGSFILGGKEYRSVTPKQSHHIGINIINQELSQVPELTISANIFLGEEYIWLNDKESNARTKILLNEVGLDCDPQEQIKNLSIGTRQLIEVVKAAHGNPKLLIMDEPTSSLSTKEINILFEYIRKLQKNNCTIIYISHKLDEVLAITNTVTIMRDGGHVATVPTSECTESKLIQLMVNREFSDVFPEVTTAPGEEVFRVENINRGDVVRDCSFVLHRGEVLGISGLVGAGRTELMRIIFGVDKGMSGKIFVFNKEVRINRPKKAIANRIGFVTEDRRISGFIPLMSIRDNITLVDLKKFSKWGIFTMQSRENKIANQYRERFAIKTPDIFFPIMDLSGGNQQKVILSKWLLEGIDILILDEPTRGIDVNAKREIYNLIHELSDKGMSVILVSSEVKEIIGLCHRAIVMCEGRITGELKRAEFDYQAMLELAFRRS
jgi:ABC-type sugar transport system ATPase subunit